MLKLLAGTVDRRDVQQGERMAAQILTHPELKSKPDIKADALLQLGGLYFNNGLYAYAAVIFAAVADEFPGSTQGPRGQVQRGDVLRAPGGPGRPAELEVLEGEEQGGPQRPERPLRRLEGSARRGLVRRRGRTSRGQGRRGRRPLSQGARRPRRSTARRSTRAASIVFGLGEAARLRDKNDEVPKNFQRAEGAYKNAVAAFETTLKTAINAAEITQLKDSLFNVRLMLAGLYIQTEMKKADEALKILEATEAT